MTAQNTQWDRGGRRLGRAMIALPALILALLIFGPLIYSIVLSLYKWQLTDINSGKPFVGFANYVHLFTDPQVLNAVGNTLIYVVGSVGTELILGFVIASALFEMTKGRKLANSLILLPMIIAPVITALIWRYMLDPQFGLVAQVLSVFGFKGGISFFGTSQLALPSLILVDVWQWTPFVILILHAGMLGISEEQFEAARIDGAGRWRILRSIVLPGIAPQILLVLLFRTMDTYRIFDTVFVLTRGGPGTSTETIGLYTYQTGFSFFDMGYAMTLGVFILITVAIISSFYIRLLRRREVFQ
ncbi:MAG: Multiple sugar transport system permease protein [Glaciihabitans sp.]|nr:Multiple sugar transport system permease protein [Glaciihabitans sp.]MDQ1571286.1 multiple sugar transport system permease protein [Actinomycetota bacterium]